jgi:5-formyltetrahydrofolate cyclo-ligase
VGGSPTVGWSWDLRSGAEVEQERKRALRAAALAARRQLTSAERAEASQQVVARLVRLPEVHRAKAVLVYAALAEEVDIAAFAAHLRAEGARTLFPRVRGDALELVSTEDLQTLQLGYRGIREPVGPVIDPELVDVAVVPGVAFDPQGGRLGQGGGHYDRLFSVLADEVPRIGVCFACQVVPTVPREPHDEVVDVVVTDRATYRSGLRRGEPPPPALG